MALVEVGSLELGGLVLDRPKFDLPSNVFTNGYNVEFTIKGVTPSPAFQMPIFDMKGSPLRIDILQILDNRRLAVYLTDTDAYSVYRGKHVKITRSSGGYSAGDRTKWSGGFFHGYMVYTNGEDVPQAYAPIGATEVFKNLPNWPAGVRVHLMRPYMNFLIGLGYHLTTEQEFDSQTIIWSDVTDPGTLPTWDITNPASKAGTYALSDTKAAIIAAEVLTDSLIIYKEDSIYSMRYVGGTYVFAFDKLVNGYGAASAYSVVSVGNEHFVVGQNELYIFNGMSSTPIGKGYVRDFLFSDWNPSARHNVFCLHREGANQIWVCYPSGSSEYANKALIWNYSTNTWTLRQIPPSYCGQYSYSELYGQMGTWGDLVTEGAWNPDMEWDEIPDRFTWVTAGNSGLEKSVYLGVAITAGDLWALKTNGVNFTYGGLSWPVRYPFPPIVSIPLEGDRAMGYVERTNIAFDGKDQNGNVTVDRTLYKTLTECYPEVSGGSVMIRFGTQKVHNGAVTWGPWSIFDPEVSYKLDPFMTEKFLAIAFQSDPNNLTAWTVSGYSLNIENGGRY